MADKKRKKDVERIVKSLKKFINTYDKQTHYQNYSNDTIIDDFLYGLGVAFDSEKHSFANGYKKWKQKLTAHLAK